MIYIGIYYSVCQISGYAVYNAVSAQWYCFYFILMIPRVCPYNEEK